MPNEMSVRQWQEQFKSGAFDSPDFYTQCKAGWYDWFCRDGILAERLKEIAEVVMGITDPFILDNFYIWFKNNCPAIGPLYDDVRFEPLTGERNGKYFLVSLDSPHERARWTLTTERFGYRTPEFESENVQKMIQYINKIGPELEQGFIPPFVAEKQAVEIYAKVYGEPSGLYVYREGDHRYSYTSFLDKKQYNVIAVADLKDAPADFVAEQAKKFAGIHVYCPENAGKSPPSLEEALAATYPERKEKGAER